jgi:glycosyltransferase involved in cell wall biosynthesis
VSADERSRGALGRIRFTEQFFYPEGWGGAELPRDVTLHLQQIGYRVEVVCGSDQYAPVEGGPGLDPAEAGIRILRIRQLIQGDIHSRKLLRQVWFYAGLLPYLFLRRPPDLFVSQTNPPLVIPLVALAAALWRKPLLLIAMDLYPEVLVAHGSVSPGGVLSRLLNAVFSRAYRAATRVVALGPVMYERIRAKGVPSERIVEISNWSTGPLDVVRGAGNSLRGVWGLTNNRVVVYSGNLGIGHEFETVLAGFAKAVADRPTLRLVIIGKGSRLAETRGIVDRLGIGATVRFADLVPAQQLPQSMGLADLALVTLRPGFEGLIVPSKMLGYMARGIPVLYVGPRSDVDVMLARYGCGVGVTNGDVKAVHRALVELCDDPDRFESMGLAGQAAYEQQLAREHGLARYAATVAECLATVHGP